MSEVGDSTKSYSINKNDILVNSNGKGCHSDHFKTSRNSLEAHSIESFPHDDDNDDKVSLRSDSYSTKFKEVDRFGFVGGNQYTNPNSGSTSLPIEILRLRELKWLDMLENWDKWMSKKFTKVKERCRKGIPDSLRARAWQLLTGSAISLANNPDRYQGYLRSQGNPLCLDEIKKDVSRQYPHHELFMDDDGQGQEDLYSVLMAYSIHDPSVGYCQAQGPLAAVLLTIMPAEQAFWMFVMICEKYLPGYYNAGLEAVQIDSMILFGLLKKTCPQAYKHLKKQKVEPILWMTDWFMCLYSRTLPWSSVLRIWDMFMCEGVKVMFRVALVLVRSVLGTSDQIKSCPTFYDTLDRLRKIPIEFMEENHLAREVSKLQISDKDMEKEHAVQLKKWNISKAQKDQKNNSSKIPKTSEASKEAPNVTKTTQDSDSVTTVIPVTAASSEISDPKVTSSTSSTSTCSSVDFKNRSAILMDLSNHQATDPPHHDSSHYGKPPSNPILPPPGSLLLPRVISSSPSLKPLISIPDPSKAIPAVVMAPTPPITTRTFNFHSSTPQASSDSLQLQKEKRSSKRFPFSSMLKLTEKNKAESTTVQVQGKSKIASEKPAQDGVAKEMPTNHEPFKRYQYKPSMSPCSSLTAVPQISDKKKTFRMSWHRSKTSKSTTNINQ